MPGFPSTPAEAGFKESEDMSHLNAHLSQLTTIHTWYTGHKDYMDQDSIYIKFQVRHGGSYL
jgi:hypothetical protein